MYVQFGCKRCVQCTRSYVGDLLMFWLRPLVWRTFFSWNVGLFMRVCPNCDHYMCWHRYNEKEP